MPHAVDDGGEVDGAVVMMLRGAQKFCKEAQGAGSRMLRALP